tara:strand:+ start:2727 stop:4439 length:1713 start_codon:yes stop_codon:yes gene_type:complete
MTRLFLFTTLTFSSLISFSQEIVTNYFRSPLDIPLFLSGNFGELRSNHFHAGLDIKTQGVEGQNVYAVADGYVSRIKVSPYGYGNAIYVTHPNGFTSVYGHLQKYNDKIRQVVEDYQYKKEEFEVELFPTPFSMQVKKGELIAYSGNSGGSGGPHLHFEIRNTTNEHPTNPLFFGFSVTDRVKPDIYAVTIYPLNDTSYVNGSNQPQRFIARGANGSYSIPLKSTIKVQGIVGFGIETVDRMSGTSNKYGLHNIKLKHNDELIFEQQIDEFAFHEGRYINSHIDFETYRKTRRRIQKSFVQEGNQLRIYKKKSGEINVSDGKEHKIKYTVSDLNENNSTVSFTVQSVDFKIQANLSSKDEKDITFMPYHQKNTLLRPNLLLNIPKGVLYEDTYFEYSETEGTSKTVSPVYWLHNHFTPIHKNMTVAIKNKGLTPYQKSKALIVSTTDKRSWYAEGGVWSGDNISVRTRSFGGYAIALDTVAPIITPINIYPNANMTNKWSITMKITDNLSGIGSCRGTVDGKWVLMAYDAKNDKLSYYFDDKVTKGNHTFKLLVKDEVGNKSVYKADFVR